MAWKVKKGDKVVVTCGRDKGHIGHIIRVLREEERVIVQGAAVRVRHRKPSVLHPEGGKIPQECPIHVSNVALLDPDMQKPTRVGFRINAEGKKERFAKRSGKVIEGK